MFLQESITITKKDLGGKVDDIKLGQKGTKKNDEGKQIYYRNYILKIRNSFFTLEFMSNDSKFEDLYAIGLYSSNRDKIKTIYFDEKVSLNNILKTIREANLMKYFSINESQNIILKEMSPDMFMTLYSVFIAIIMIVVKVYQIKKQATLAYVGYDADKSAEKELNEFLFKNQKENDPAFDSFKTTSNYLKTIIDEKSDKKGLILYGIPGASKTYMIRRTLHFSNLSPGSDYVIYKGSTANKQNNTDIVYEILFRENGKLIIFDDFDSVIEDENVVNILKAALDSYPVRVISLPNKGSWDTSDVERIPPKFRFTGKIVIITNKTDIEPALKSRALTQKVEYTEKEWLDNINKLLNYLSPEVDRKIKEEVLDFVQYSMSKDNNLTIDFRRFSSIVDLRLAYPNEWKDMGLTVMKAFSS